MGYLVGGISIEDLVLVPQSARARDDAASVVGFHAVGCVERRGRGLGGPSRFRDGVDPRTRRGTSYCTRGHMQEALAKIPMLHNIAGSDPADAGTLERKASAMGQQPRLMGRPDPRMRQSARKATAT